LSCVFLDKLKILGVYNMKKLLAALLLSVIALQLSFAQEEPIPPKRSKAARVGGFIGITPAWLFVDVKPINEVLVKSGGAELKDGGVFMFGGAGAAYIMLVPNLRVGGLGMSGSISSAAVDAFGVRRDAKLNVGFGGITFEYLIPVVDKLDIAVGSMVGWGGIDITMRKDFGGQSTWDQQWGYLAGTGNVTNTTRKLTGSYFVWVPSVNIEYAILGWVGLRLGASYVGMSAPSWKVDDNYELLGVPSNVSGKGFMINAGVFVGTY
jgi:hypothetical protein